MTVKNNSNNESAVETHGRASLTSNAPSTADLQIRIRELEKEIARLHSQIKEQRYGLTWLDVPEAFETESENKIPILEEVKEKAIDAAGRDALNASANNTPPHIIIEGDNYHALSCLNYTHRGKIDVIYIDPPYNTGNDGFTYKDKRFLKEFPDGSPVPKEHPLRHSYWLSFMSKRLELAKNLLSDKGVIFISIDDNEQANLKLLCDRVFGEENFTGGIIWFKKRKGSFLSNTLVSLTEYVLPYTKGNDVKLFGGLPDNNESQPIIKRTNAIKRLHFNANVVKTKLSNGFYEAGEYGIGTSASILHNRIEIKDGYIITDFDISAPFTWTQDFLDEEINNGTEVFINTKNFQVRVIRKNNSSTKAIESFIDGREISATNEDAYESLKNLFSTDRPFLYSKPLNLLKKLILSATYYNKSSTILDFFAGSGTTLHATMKLNAEDGGHRQCILVQQREGDNNICENVTYERNRRVMCGYTNAKGEQVEGLGGRLKYYRTAFVGKHASHNAIDADRVELSRKAGYLLALGENTLEEIAHTDTYQIFADTRRDDVNIVSESNSLASCYTAIYFTENYAKMPEFVAEIKKLQASEPSQFNVYIFCWGTPEIFEGEFDDLRGIALKAIPQPILDVYKSINQ